MAFSFSFKGLIKSKSVAGVDIFILPDGGKKINYTALSKKKNVISVSDSATDVTDIPSLKNSIDPKTPVFVSIQGKGLLHKKAEGDISLSDAECLHKVLPNAKTEDFYVQKVAGASGTIFISVIRKASADELLNEFKQSGFEVIGCSLGVLGVRPVLPFLENKSGYFELIFSGYKLLVNNGVIEDYQLSEKAEVSVAVRIGEESVNANMLSSFSAAFQYFLPDENGVSIHIPSVGFAKEEFNQRRIFQLAGMAILSFFFAVLLINYFVFDHYWARKQALTAKMALNQDALQRLEKLKKEYDEKQQFFQNTGLLNSSRTSFYADRIAVDVPPAIRLNDLNIHPAVRKLNDENTISFTPKSLIVSGTSSRSTELNEWINRLKKKEFVSDVVLLSFSQDKSRESGLFNLEVKIK